MRKCKGNSKAAAEGKVMTLKRNPKRGDGAIFVRLTPSAEIVCAALRMKRPVDGFAQWATDRVAECLIQGLESATVMSEASPFYANVLTALSHKNIDRLEKIKEHGIQPQIAINLAIAHYFDRLEEDAVLHGSDISTIGGR